MELNKIPSKRVVLLLIASAFLFGTILILADLVFMTRPRRCCIPSEATAILSDIRIKQEAYIETFKQYKDLSRDGWLPDDSPEYETRDWPHPSKTGQWNHLGVHPDDAVYYSYFSEAGLPGQHPSSKYLSRFRVDTSKHWYIAVALDNLYEDGKCGGLVVMSGEVRIEKLSRSAENCQLMKNDTDRH